MNSGSGSGTGTGPSSGSAGFGRARAVFLDRDNTIIHNEGDLGDPDLVRLIRGAAHAIGSLHHLGYHIIVVTNQGGVARGAFTEDDVQKVHQRIADLVHDVAGAAIDRFYYCPYHPEGSVEEYTREHPWRKPQPGMLLQAAADLHLDLAQSWMVGDQLRDIRAGKTAGCQTVLIDSAGAYVNLHSTHPEATPPDFRVTTIAEAAAVIAQNRMTRAGRRAIPLAAPSRDIASPEAAAPKVGESPRAAPAVQSEAGPPPLSAASAPSTASAVPTASKAAPAATEADAQSSATAPPSPRRSRRRTGAVARDGHAEHNFSSGGDIRTPHAEADRLEPRVSGPADDDAGEDAPAQAAAAGITLFDDPSSAVAVLATDDSAATATATAMAHSSDKQHDPPPSLVAPTPTDRHGESAVAIIDPPGEAVAAGTDTDDAEGSVDDTSPGIGEALTEDDAENASGPESPYSRPRPAPQIRFPAVFPGEPASAPATPGAAARGGNNRGAPAAAAQQTRTHVAPLTSGADPDPEAFAPARPRVALHHPAHQQPAALPPLPPLPQPQQQATVNALRDILAELKSWRQSQREFTSARLLIVLLLVTILICAIAVAVYLEPSAAIPWVGVLIIAQLTVIGLLVNSSRS